MINQAYLISAIDYNPLSGDFTWKKGHHLAGKKAGTLLSSGYVYIKIRGTKYMAHRLAWLYMHGSFPDVFIDHINGSRNDNRIENLRKASGSQNQHNRKVRRDSSSGVKGVCFVPSSGRWRARIKIHGKEINAGYFSTMEEAAKAISITRAKLHGDFARD